MSIVRMAMIPGYVDPAQSVLPPVRRSGGAARTRRPKAVGRRSRFDWQTLLAESYAAIGLVLIVGYVLWVLFIGEHTLPWAGEVSPTE
jgi:hypothetical protein